MTAAQVGDDGPGNDDVEVMRYQAYADALAAARVLAHEIFTDLLEPDQVILWVLEGRSRQP